MPLKAPVHLAITSLLMMFLSASAHSADKLPEPGTATDFTAKSNQAVLKELNFEDKEDFSLATKGFIATLPNPKIPAKDQPFDLNAFNFTFNKPAPSTANPSLWRQSQLTAQNGLYKVTDKIYQIRGFDVSNMTLIEGKSGWIIIDPLTSVENAAAGMNLVNEKLGKRPIKAVIFTHSHADHFGGVLGVITPADIKSKKVQIIAPEGFLEEAVSENLYAGNIMSRRATMMYGNYLPNNPSGNLGTGLGPGVSAGEHSIAIPTKLIKKTGEKINLDGVEIVFQMAPGTEAPSEMLFYFPQMKALCLSEDATATMHNLYTLRGAKVRSPLVWANALNTTLEMFGDKAEVSFASHHWPRWENEKIREFITNQRDMYKFINDQTLRLANQGYDAEEIAERIKLPDSIGKKFYNRGYYGSLNHDVKATYQLYLGFFNGNPATLHQHPRITAAKLYVDAMGGPDKVLKIGRDAFNRGDYRWTAEVVNHLVYASPNNKDALQLQAAALEQMGFQSESAPWRDFYLSAAKELRDGHPNFGPALVDTRSLPLSMLFDYTALRLNPEKAAGKKMTIGVTATDTKEKYTLTLNNSTLFATKSRPGEKFDSTLNMKSSAIGSLFGGYTKADSNSGRVGELLAMLDTFNQRANMVIPVDEKSPPPKQMAEATNENEVRQ